MYVPLCFAYILPVGRYGLLNGAIPPEVSGASKRPFVVMGLLDCLAGTLLTFASVRLPGSLLILLPQAAIPISMLLSSRIKGERYAPHQYLGALVVVLGILAVMEPLVSRRHDAGSACEAYDPEGHCALCGAETTEAGCLGRRAGVGIHAGTGPPGLWDAGGDDAGVPPRPPDGGEGRGDDDRDGGLCRWVPSAESSAGADAATTLLVWSAVTILACVPMTLSSICKEMKLGGDGGGIDPIFLNGWVAVFQLLFSIALGAPAGMTSDPPVTPRELPGNVVDGIRCYLGSGTVTSGCHPDDGCREAPLYVNAFLVFNVGFNILMVYILK